MQGKANKTRTDQNPKPKQAKPKKQKHRQGTEKNQPARRPRRKTTDVAQRFPPTHPFTLPSSTPPIFPLLKRTDPTCKQHRKTPPRAAKSGKFPLMQTTK